MAPTVGLPRMHKDQGERRDFLPDLIAHLDRLGTDEIVLEEGYGLGVGVPTDAYLDVSGRARVGSYGECLDKDVVVVLRCPELVITEIAVATVGEGVVEPASTRVSFAPTASPVTELRRRVGVRDDELSYELHRALEGIECGWHARSRLEGT